jgi:hypothetical protein
MRYRRAELADQGVVGEDEDAAPDLLLIASHWAPAPPSRLDAERRLATGWGVGPKNWDGGG